MDEMRFAVLGPASAGKTTLLACMAQEFARLKPGIILPESGKTMESLLNAYRALKDEADDPRKMSFERPIAPSVSLREYAFTINGERASMPVKFCDFPGEWMNPGSSENKKVIDIVKDASVIIIAINTPYLMELDGRYKDTGCATDEISFVLETALTADKSKRERLILFVPIKCERYLESRDISRALVSTVRLAFERVLNLSSDPRYSGRLAMAMLPVQTVGSVKFWRFMRDRDERITAEVYRKDKSSDVFRPVNVDQPMRYMMSFLIEQSARDEKRASWWRKLFHRVTFRGDLKEVAEYIRKGIKSDNDLSAGFEIFCGRDLIGFPSHS